MTELIKLLLEIAHSISPFRIVYIWQRGLYFVLGRYWKTVGPGLKFVVPYLTDVHLVSMVPAVHCTALQTITLRDGKALTYSATIVVQVVDAEAAFNRLEHWQESVVELASGVLSDGLADADPARFDPARGKRDRLLMELRDDINEACKPFGVEIHSVRLNNFAVNVRTYRLLMDRATLQDTRP